MGIGCKADELADFALVKPVNSSLRWLNVWAAGLMRGNQA
jgi:hypothetical protein